MASRRRAKVIAIVLFAVVITVLYYTSTSSKSSAAEQNVGDFYYKTKTALGNENTGDSPDIEQVKSDVKGKKDAGEEEVTKKMSERLKEAAQVAKDNANAKAPKPDPPSLVVGKGSSQEGKDKAVGKGRKGKGGDSQTPVKEETQEDHEVEQELNTILKKSPSKYSPCLVCNKLE